MPRPASWARSATGAPSDRCSPCRALFAPKRAWLTGEGDTACRLKSHPIKAPDGPTPAPPATVIGFYPGTDVTDMWERDVGGSRNAAQMFTGGTHRQYPARYREVSPTHDVGQGLQPTLLVVGDRDRSAPPSTVRHLAAALRAEGADTTLKELPFADHAFDDAYGSLTSQTSRQILLDFPPRLSRRATGPAPGGRSCRGW